MLYFSMPQRGGEFVTILTQIKTTERNMKRKALFLTEGAVIAALYVVLTEVTTLFGLSSGVLQFRLSEALCVLTAFTPAAIPALAVGCLISNLLAGCLPIDLLVGTLATLVGAVGGYLLRRVPLLVPLPTVLANTLVIPFILAYAYGAPGGLPYFFLTVAVGETVCAYILGMLLYITVRRYGQHLHL